MNYINSTSQYKPTIITNKNSNVFEQFERKSLKATKAISYSPEVKENRKKAVIIKSSIVALLVGSLASLASRKFRFNALKVLQNLKLNNEAFLNNAREAIANKEAPIMLKVKIGIMRTVTRVSNSFINILGNVDHYKNRLSGQVADSIPGIGSGINFVNNKLKPFFTGIVHNASFSKYKTADKAANQLKDLVNEMALRNPELRKYVGSSADDLVAAISKLSDQGAISARNGELNTLLKSAVKEYNNQVEKLFKTTNIGKSTEKIFEETISLNIAKNTLLPHHLELLKLKRAVTFSPHEKIKVIDKLIDALSTSKGLEPNVAIINKLKNVRGAFAKAPTEANRQALLDIFQQINKEVNHPIVKRAFTEAKIAVSINEAGIVQQLLKQVEAGYKNGEIGKQTYEVLSKQLDRVHKSVSTAVNFEKENLAGRLLDIAIGPVPFLETTSLTVPAIALANEIIQAENTKERVSKSLVYGPTIAGGIGACVFALNKGIYGVNALLFGAVTGYIFNKLGTFVDDKYYSKGREFNTLKVLSSDETKNIGVKIVEM